MEILQACALTYRRHPLEVLMVTSRSSGRWIFPKGLIEPGTTPQQTALQEAWEEAGASGTLSNFLGQYQDQKWGQTLRVLVFALEIAEMHEHWQEESLRQRRWMTIPEALEVLAGHPQQPVLQGWLEALVQGSNCDKI